MTNGKGVDDFINTLIPKKVLKKGLFNYGQDIVMAFSSPVVGCLVKKCLQKGGSRAPQDLPLATPMKIILTKRPVFFLPWQVAGNQNPCQGCSF